MDAKKILASVLVSGTIALLGLTCREVKSPGKEVYNGDIDGRQVVYYENYYGAGSRNSMRIVDENTTYTLVDNSGQENVTSQNFSNQSLEKIVIQSGDKKEVLNRSEKSSNEPRQKYQEKVFEKADRLYNDAREQIRAQIEKQYEKAAESFPQMEVN
jgi:hypothetical protein